MNLLELCPGSDFIAVLTSGLLATSAESCTLAVSSKAQKGWSRPRNWCIPFGHDLTSGLYQRSHSLFDHWLIHGVIRGSGFVITRDPEEICTYEVWLKLRGVRSSTCDCLWATFPAGNECNIFATFIRSDCSYTPSSGTLSLLFASCCNPRTVSSSCLDLFELGPMSVFFCSVHFSSPLCLLSIRSYEPHPPLSLSLLCKRSFQPWARRGNLVTHFLALIPCY